MSRVMFVTMGTSLFHSASWQPKEGALPAEIPDYDEWLAERLPGDERPSTKESPDARLGSLHARSIRNRLEGELRCDNGAAWAEYLPPDLLAGRPAEPMMRYGAELATILKLWQEEASEDELSTFLGSYSTIQVVSDDDDGRPSVVAGAHLVAYLDRCARRAVAEPLRVRDLASRVPWKLLGRPGEGEARSAGWRGRSAPVR